MLKTIIFLALVIFALFSHDHARSLIMLSIAAGIGIGAFLDFLKKPVTP